MLYKEVGEAGAAPTAPQASVMLSAQERVHIAQVWDLIAGHEAPFGAELLLRWAGEESPGSQRGGDWGVGPATGGGRYRGFPGVWAAQAPKGLRPPPPLHSRRLFTAYPSTKTYFTHLGDSPDQARLLSHGRRLLEAVGVAVQHVDNLRAALSPLADLHAHVLRVDPTNFPVSHPGRQQGLPAQPRG